MPLAFSIQKAEGVQLGGWHRLNAVSSLGADTPEYDWFGVGTYLNLSDAEALNTSRFDLQQSGLRMDTGILNRGNFRTAKIEIEIIKLPARFKFLGLFAIRQYVSVALAGILNERAGGARPEGGDPAVTVAPESWTHLGPEGARRNAASLNAAQAFVEAKRFGGVALPAVDAALDLTGVF